MNWLEELNRITYTFQEEFGQLNTEILNWKPAPQVWSIAQNIDHLIVVNSTYFPVLSSLHQGHYQPAFTAKFGFLVTFFGKTVLNAVQPDRKQKMKTFPVWEPSESQFGGDILDRFIQHQQELKKQIEASTKLIQAGTVISSPANRFIVYKLETAFDIMVTHEQRHLEQAREVLQIQSHFGH